MTDNETQQTEQTEQPQGEETQGIDWKAEARKWEGRAKRDGEELAKLRSASTELAEAERRLAEAEERAADAEKEAATLKEQEQKRVDAETIAKETGVPATLLGHLPDMDSMRQHAEAIKAAYPSGYPVIHDSGEPKKNTVTRESILAITNEKERLAAIRENASLFQ